MQTEPRKVEKRKHKGFIAACNSISEMLLQQTIFLKKGYLFRNSITKCKKLCFATQLMKRS